MHGWLLQASVQVANTNLPRPGVCVFSQLGYLVRGEAAEGKGLPCSGCSFRDSPEKHGLGESEVRSGRSAW